MGYTSWWEVLSCSPWIRTWFERNDLSQCFSVIFYRINPSAVQRRHDWCRGCAYPVVLNSIALFLDRWTGEPHVGPQLEVTGMGTTVPELSQLLFDVSCCFDMLPIYYHVACLKWSTQKDHIELVFCWVESSKPGAICTYSSLFLGSDLEIGSTQCASMVYYSLWLSENLRIYAVDRALPAFCAHFPKLALRQHRSLSLWN